MVLRGFGVVLGGSLGYPREALLGPFGRPLKLGLEGLGLIFGVWGSHFEPRRWP